MVSKCLFCDMTPSEALITAARHYCKDNFAYWATRYASERRGADFPYSYSNSDYDLFPRYNALSAILDSVETMVGEECTDLQECRNSLAEKGLSASSIFTTDVKNAIEKAAIQDEREKFVRFVQSITLGELGLVEPLPHRRRLKEDESGAVRQELCTQWNFDGQFWDPLENKSPAETLFLSKDSMTKEDHQSIIDFIVENASSYLMEITEDGKDAEIDPKEFHPDCYETIYCDNSYSWIVYGSHESTVTFAGQALLEFVKKLFRGREYLFNEWPKYN
jgi:hypothetical protein